jgi:hypothetical protein
MGFRPQTVEIREEPAILGGKNFRTFLLQVRKVEEDGIVNQLEDRSGAHQEEACDYIQRR